MAAQPQTDPATEERFSTPRCFKGKAKLRAIESGELVSNEPLRERCEWLMRFDPEFSLGIVCHRLADLGYPKFVRPGTGASRGRIMPETTHLQRLLGLMDQSTSFKRGRRYVPPSRTEFVQYDMGVALARALDMDPVDAGV